MVTRSGCIQGSHRLEKQIGTDGSRSCLSMSLCCLQHRTPQHSRLPTHHRFCVSSRIKKRIRHFQNGKFQCRGISLSSRKQGFLMSFKVLYTRSFPLCFRCGFCVCVILFFPPWVTEEQPKICTSQFDGFCLLQFQYTHELDSLPVS